MLIKIIESNEEHNNEAEIITDEEVSLRIVSSLRLIINASFAFLYCFFSYSKNLFELTFDLIGFFVSFPYLRRLVK
jgi:hypothetical protein